MHLIRACFTSSDKILFAKAAWLLFNIWIDRNKIIFQKATFSITNFLHSIRNRFSGTNFQLHAARHGTSSNTSARNDAPSFNDIALPPAAVDDLPTQRPVTCRVDAAYSVTRCTYAVVISDSNEDFLEAISGPSVANSALHAESQALLACLQLLATRCFPSVTILTDSLSLVNYIYLDHVNWPWSIHQTLTDCCSLWHPPYIEICHAPRTTNVFAHQLCQQCDRSSSRHYSAADPLIAHLLS